MIKEHNGVFYDFVIKEPVKTAVEGVKCPNDHYIASRGIPSFMTNGDGVIFMK